MSFALFCLVPPDTRLKLHSDLFFDLSKSFWTGDEVENSHAYRESKHRKKVGNSHCKCFRLVQEPGHLKSIKLEHNLLTKPVAEK